MREQFSMWLTAAPCNRGSASRLRASGLIARHSRAPQRRGGEQGFALIMILFGAAVMMVLLAKSLPRDAMSAQRIREERLINRGEEYARAIKLYFREHKKYPEDLDDLEDTDGVRYLRRRYKDPITGQDEWRLIRMGTDGRFKDSLLHDLEEEEGEGMGMAGGTPMGNRVRTSASRNNPWKQTAVTGFDGGARALQERESAAPENPLDLSGQGPYGGAFPGQEGADGQQGEGQQLGPDGQPLPPDYSQVRPGDVPFNAGQLSPEQLADQQAMQAAAAAAGQSGRSGFGGRQDARRSRIGNAFGGAAQAQQQAPPGGAMNPQGGVAPQAADVIQRLLTTPRPGGLAGLRGSQNAMQQLQGQGQGMNQFQEGIAGVASQSEATGVKVYNGEESFNLWEFVYDYRQDEAMAGAMPGAAGGMGPGGLGQGGIQPGQPGMTPGGTLGGAPGQGGGLPGLFGGAQPGAVPGNAVPGSAIPGGGITGAAQPGSNQPGSNDPRGGAFGNSSQPNPYPTATPYPTTPTPGDRPQRGTGGFNGPSVVPTRPGQQPPDLQELIQQQILQQQQPQN